MIEKNVFVRAATGLHARPVSLLLNLTKTYKGSVSMVLNGKAADLKSILGIMALQVKHGDEITVRVDGPDEDVLCDQIVNLIQTFND